MNILNINKNIDEVVTNNRLEDMVAKIEGTFNNKDKSNPTSILSDLKLSETEIINYIKNKFGTSDMIITMMLIKDIKILTMNEGFYIIHDIINNPNEYPIYIPQLLKKYGHIK